MDAVAEAVRKARYNEAIILNVTSDGNPSETREIVLTATLDETNGGIVWNDASNGIENEDTGIVRHLRTKRWILPMLNDTRRNELFDKAIRAASTEAARRFKSQSDHESCVHCLDIGTGTGLLAMMTSKHLQAALHSDCLTDSPVAKLHITSLEMANAMGRLAKLTIASNDLEDSIEILEEHSCEANLDHSFRMCTSELLESGLLGEGILPSIRDAWERHLHPDAVVVPQRARVYAQLIESSELVGNLCGPHLSAADGDSLRLSTSQDRVNVLLGGNIVVPIHAESLFSSDMPSRLLTDPLMAMSFDFSNKEAIPGPSGQRRTINVTPVATGVAHGVLFWWELDVWGDLTYSTQQGKEPWQDHWQQCLFVFEQGLQVYKGQAVNLSCSHTDDRLCFTLECPSKAERETKRLRIGRNQSSSTTGLIYPERALQLNNIERLVTIRRAIQYALKHKGADAHFLDLSDFSLCAILAALEGASFVSSVESSSGDLPVAATMVSQANGLPRTWDGKVAHYQILKCHSGNLTSELFYDNPAEIVAAEPYYEVLEGWHLQEALNYFYSQRSLRKRGLIDADAISIPSYAAVMVCGIMCNSLARSYQGCGDNSEAANVCGFRHSVVKEYGDRYHQHGFPIRSCEYKYTQLTDAVEVSRLCYNDSTSIIGNGVPTKVPFRTAGTCHGILSWVEYGMQVEATKQLRLSTRNRSHCQLFQLLPTPVAASEDGLLVCQLELGALEGVEDHRFDIRVAQHQLHDVDYSASG